MGQWQEPGVQVGFSQVAAAQWWRAYDITPDWQVALMAGVGHQDAPSFCSVPLLSLQTEGCSDVVGGDVIVVGGSVVVVGGSVVGLVGKVTSTGTSG